MSPVPFDGRRGPLTPDHVTTSNRAAITTAATIRRINITASLGMVKRVAEDGQVAARPAKRSRLDHDSLSSLSDELVLRIFSSFSIQELNLCQRVSSRFRTLAGDSQLWRDAYHRRFVQPRLERIARRKSTRSAEVNAGSRWARWLDEGDLVRRGRDTNWKRQYKIRHNWARGACDVNEIPVDIQAPLPMLLARLLDGIVYTVDVHNGLRAWSYKDDERLLATVAARVARDAIPTSMAVLAEDDSTRHRIAIGYDDGTFCMYHFGKDSVAFRHEHTCHQALDGAITALALSSQYLLCMTQTQQLSLFRVPTRIGHDDDLAPLLLSSLKSQTAWPPLSLSLRMRGGDVLASIAYCMPTYTAGWTTGIQELLFSESGIMLESRLASAAGLGFSSLARDPGPASSQNSPRRMTVLPSPETVQSKPTSVSYSHPYLLVSHSDNNMTLYMVTSTKSQLSLGAGRTLWGHTSSIFNAHVGGRGKAVSVSARGDEIRVWELEGGLSRRDTSGENMEESIQITPDKRKEKTSQLTSRAASMAHGGEHVSLLVGLDATSIPLTRGWVGLDDESVVVLREREHGLQALTVFDFS